MLDTINDYLNDQQTCIIYLFQRYNKNIRMISGYNILNIPIAPVEASAVGLTEVRVTELVVEGGVTRSIGQRKTCNTLNIYCLNKFLQKINIINVKT